MILNADVIKSSKIEALKTKVKNLDSVPSLVVILVGENPASKIYVRNKLKFCSDVGVGAKLVHLDSSITECELLNIIDTYNQDENTHGLFVQLPVPDHISEEKIVAAIDGSKDVDGFTHQSIGNLFLGTEGLYPCTVEAVIDIIEYYNIDIVGKTFVIVGRSNIVGKPLSLRLINLGATVIVCNSKTDNIKKYIDVADVFISAIGSPRYFNSTHFCDNPKIKIIDVGINRDQDNKTCGDVDFEDVKNNVEAITPVPGGVGILTVVHVVENTIIACQNIK